MAESEVMIHKIAEFMKYAKEEKNNKRANIGKHFCGSSDVVSAASYSLGT